MPTQNTTTVAGWWPLEVASAHTRSATTATGTTNRILRKPLCHVMTERFDGVTPGVSALQPGVLIALPHNTGSEARLPAGGIDEICGWTP